MFANFEKKSAAYIMHIHCPKCGHSIGMLHMTNEEAIYYCSTTGCDYTANLTGKFNEVNFNNPTFEERSVHPAKDDCNR